MKMRHLYRCLPVSAFWTAFAGHDVRPPFGGCPPSAASSWVCCFPKPAPAAAAGYTHMIAPSALVEVQRDAVLVGTSGLYGLVAMEVSSCCVRAGWRLWR